MSKKKQTKPRPRFMCLKCGQAWVKNGETLTDAVCISCGIAGKPMNEGAEKIIKKLYNAEQLYSKYVFSELIEEMNSEYVPIDKHDGKEGDKL